MDRNFYYNLPVHARYLDEHGILEHFSDAVQRQLDYYKQQARLVEYYENPDTAPAEWLYYLQQWVGGYGTPDRYLGVGIHPDWPENQMRRFVKNAWNYWSIKGTELGIRQAIWLWLDWEKSLDSKYVTFRKPGGDKSDSTPPRWWGYDTPLLFNKLKSYPELKLIGGGDYPSDFIPRGLNIQSDYNYWDYKEQWWINLSDTLNSKKREAMKNCRSCMGPRNVELHNNLETDKEWNQLSPDIHKLNPEMWSALARPIIWLWIERPSILKTVLPVPKAVLPVEKIFSYDIAGYQYNDKFPQLKSETLLIETVVERNWVIDPFFKYDDIWGGVGDKILGVESIDSIEEKENKQWGLKLQETGFISSGSQYSNLYHFVQAEEAVYSETPVIMAAGSYYDVIPFLWNAEVVKKDEVEPANTVYSDGYAWTKLEQIELIKTLTEKVIVSSPSEVAPWYAPPGVISEIIIVTEPTSDNIPLWGISTQLIVGEEEIIIPGIAGTESNHKLLKVEGEVITEIIPAQIGSEGMNYGDTFNPKNSWPEMTSDDLPSWPVHTPWSSASELEDLPDGVQPQILPINEIASDSIIGDLSLSGNLIEWSDSPKSLSLEPWPEPLNEIYYYESGEDRFIEVGRSDLWQYNAKAEEIIETTTLPGYKEIPPRIVSHYNSWQDRAFTWCGASTSGTEDTITKIPIIKNIKLLGVPAFYATFNLENEEWISNEAEYTLKEQFPLLEKIADGSNWKLILETKSSMLQLRGADTIYSSNDANLKSNNVSPATHKFLNLEFITKIDSNTTIHSASLFLEDHGLVEWNEYLEPLRCHPDNRMGFKFKLEMKLIESINSLESVVI